MYTTNSDRYRLLDTDARTRIPIPPRRSFFSRYKYLILLFAIAVIALSIVVPLVIVGHIKNISADANHGPEKDNSFWADSFNITTDWDKSWPETGVTRYYTFTVTEIDEYMGPDGVIKQKAMLVNGQYPGPVIIADWGDRIQVTVINQLQHNGTSIHWHGFRQHNNNANDGASGVTECPIPPGHNKTYSFQATQYGTSWYHSHLSSQYTNGVVGAIQINGPASYPYDIDLGVFPISDWYYSPADILLSRVFDPLNPFVPVLPGSPPPSDNVLFNGTNVSPPLPSPSNSSLLYANSTTSGAGGGGGNYAKVKFTPGKRHRLRLINTSADNTFTISIVSHGMTVIATDFVPVNPYPVESVYLTVGQRVDVVIDANQPVNTYWLNATFSATQACGSSLNPFPAAIVQYDSAPWRRPGDVGAPPKESYCEDDVGPVPVVQRANKAPGAMFNATKESTLDVSLAVNSTVSKVYWAMNNRSIDVDWDRPTLGRVLNNGKGTLDSESNAKGNVIEIPGKSQWSIWLVQNFSPIPHPVHLHGHDFTILARSPAPQNPFSPDNRPTTFSPSTDSWRLFPSQNPTPMRRDTTVLPGFGWLVIAFEVDNPGLWLFHCHISWHASQGLSVQFLERGQDILSQKEGIETLLEGVCPAWREYNARENPWPKIDSGV